MNTENAKLADGIAEEMSQYPDLARLSSILLIRDIQLKFIVPYAVAWGAVCRFRDIVGRLGHGQG